jgi:hypothetical protein
MKDRMKLSLPPKCNIISIGAVKIYVAAVKALRKNERQDETQFTTKM